MGGGHMLPYSWRQWAFGSNCKGPYRAFPLGTPVFEWQLCERVISLNLRKLPVTSPWVWLAPLVNRFHTTTELATSYVYIKGTFFGPSFLTSLCPPQGRFIPLFFLLSNKTETWAMSSIGDPYLRWRIPSLVGDSLSMFSNTGNEEIFPAGHRQQKTTWQRGFNPSLLYSKPLSSII